MIIACCARLRASHPRAENTHHRTGLTIDWALSVNEARSCRDVDFVRTRRSADQFTEAEYLLGPMMGCMVFWMGESAP